MTDPWGLPNWRVELPRGVLDPTDPEGFVISTPTERRMLHWIEGVLAVSGTTDELRHAGRLIKSYLHDTCPHHWMAYPGDEEIAAHKQCLWCHTIEWTPDAPLPGQEELSLAFGDDENPDAGYPARAIETVELPGGAT